MLLRWDWIRTHNFEAKVSHLKVILETLTIMKSDENVWQSGYTEVITR